MIVIRQAFPFGMGNFSGVNSLFSFGHLLHFHLAATPIFSLRSFLSIPFSGFENSRHGNLCEYFFVKSVKFLQDRIVN